MRTHLEAFDTICRWSITRHENVSLHARTRRICRHRSGCISGGRDGHLFNAQLFGH